MADPALQKIFDLFPDLQNIDPESMMQVIAESGAFFEAYRDDVLGLAEISTAEGQLIRLPRKPDQILGNECIPGIRDLFIDIVTLKTLNAVVLAPRGGGKSSIVGIIIWVTWVLANWDWFVVGGSENQAKKVYGYFRENLYRFLPLIGNDFLVKSVMEETKSREFGKVEVGAASHKRVRSPHMGGENKPGGLIIDEMMEAADSIVEAAQYTTNTANPAIEIITSTAHKAEGKFLDIVDGAPSNGYTLYGWDIFDVAQKCPYKCEDCPVPDFAEAVYEEDSDTGEIVLIHEAYCGGRAQVAEGWIPVDSIINLWNKVPRESFEQEAMCLRTLTSGYVINDRKGLIAAFEHKKPKLPKDSTRVIAIDWGWSAQTFIGLVIADADGRPVLIRAKFYTHSLVEKILPYLVMLRKQFNVVDVYADGSHPFNNAQLRRAGFKVKGTQFDVHKGVSVSRLNAHIEHGSLVIPVTSLDTQQQRTMGMLLAQLRAWRKKGGRIVKGNDHGPDMLICAMRAFPPVGEDIAGVYSDDDSNDELTEAFDEADGDLDQLTDEQLKLLMLEAGSIAGNQGASWFVGHGQDTMVDRLRVDRVGVR